MDAYTCNDLVVLHDSLVHKRHWLRSQTFLLIIIVCICKRIQPWHFFFFKYNVTFIPEHVETHFLYAFL